MYSKTSFLVLGAGELGMALLRSLAEQRGNLDLKIAVLLREDTLTSTEPGPLRKTAELRQLGIDFVRGDIAAASGADLAALLAPYETVIGATGFVAGPGAQRKLVHAALEAGVKRYVPWQFGVDYDILGRGSAQDLFDEQLDVREVLRAQRHTEWVIISTGMFTSFLFEPAFGVVDLENAQVHALGSWNNAVTLTTVEDIGTLTAKVLLGEREIANQVVFVAGDTVTYGQVLEAVKAILGRKIRQSVWTVAMLEDALRKDPTNAMAKYRLIFANGKGVSWDVSKTFNDQIGYQTTTMKGWLEEKVGNRSRIT